MCTRLYDYDENEFNGLALSSYDKALIQKHMRKWGLVYCDEHQFILEVEDVQKFLFYNALDDIGLKICDSQYFYLLYVIGTYFKKSHNTEFNGHSEEEFQLMLAKLVREGFEVASDENFYLRQLMTEIAESGLI